MENCNTLIDLKFLYKIFYLESVPNVLDKSSQMPKLAQPLPRAELEDLEEKARLISQILELQNTLEGKTKLLEICLILINYFRS